MENNSKKGTKYYGKRRRIIPFIAISHAKLYCTLCSVRISICEHPHRLFETDLLNDKVMKAWTIANIFKTKTGRSNSKKKTAKLNKIKNIPQLQSQSSLLYASCLCCYNFDWKNQSVSVQLFDRWVAGLRKKWEKKLWNKKSTIIWTVYRLFSVRYLLQKQLFMHRGHYFTIFVFEYQLWINNQMNKRTLVLVIVTPIRCI